MPPPPLPIRSPNATPTAVIVRPHRSQTILILACCAFLFAPCGFIAMLMVRRDLKAMADGSMDRQGEALAKLSRLIAMVASIVWLMKWLLLITIGIIAFSAYNALK